MHRGECLRREKEGKRSEVCEGEKGAERGLGRVLEGWRRGVLGKSAGKKIEMRIPVPIVP